jgi:oligoendopeptidase F
MDPALADEVGHFFDEGRLDAGPRRAKRPGAFCAPVPGGKPHVLLSYTETWGSLVTLAHELGHGVHFVLSASEQSYLQSFGMSKVIAETASEFGECLLRDHVVETTEDSALKRQVAVSEVERFINVVFRQLLFTEFELAVHERAAKQPITADSLCDLWVEFARGHYGPDVELLETDRVGWATVGHFVFNPFYCYSYALSQVVVLALYRKWKREGKGFLPKFLGLLRGGWSGSPVELLERAGIDLMDSGVLEEAFLEFEERVAAVREAIG